MKSLITKLATLKLTTLCLISGAMLSPLFVGARSAMALPDKEVTNKLGSVVVYTVSIVDEKSKQVVPLTAEVEQNKKKFNLAFVFFSSKDASDFLTKQKSAIAELKKTNPKEAEQAGALYDKAVVAPESLATFYDAAVKANSDLRLEFIPMLQQVQNAKKLEPKFQGVPLFRVDFGQSRYSTALFFSKEDLEAELERLKKTDPKLTANTKVEVVPLDGVIEVLRRETMGYVKQMELIPTMESRQLLQSVIKQQMEAAEKAKGAKPAPKK